MKSIVVISMILLACMLMAVQTKADVITPKPDAVRFAFQRNDYSEPKSTNCNLLTTIDDKARPEIVILGTTHVLLPSSLVFGFTLTVGDRLGENQMTPVALASGDLSVENFNTNGVFYGGVIEGGKIQKSTADSDNAKTLWSGLVERNFSIHITRAAPGSEPRTYVITQRPSRDALGKYLACSAEIVDIALGETPSQEQLERIRQGGPGITEDMKMPVTPDHPYASVIPALALQPPLVGKR
jgi:hypothetical protein